MWMRCAMAKNVLLGGIMEHIEQAGVHSGDSACSLPPYSLSPAIQDELRQQTVAMAKALGVVGLMNVQFAIKGQGDQARGLCAGSQSARIANGALCFQGNRPSTGQDCSALHGRAILEIARCDRRNHSALFLGQRSGFPFRKFPWC
jgi:hypothetical protein